MVTAYVFKTAALVSAFFVCANAQLPLVTIKHPSGSLAEVFLFGAHLKTFRTATSPNDDVLFMSKKSNMDGVNPIRGGCPVIFPNFGSKTGLPSHGFARISNWTFQGQQKAVNKKDPSVANFTLESSNATLAIWPYTFKLTYSVKLYANTLETCFTVDNTHASPMKFHVLLHNYFLVPNVGDGNVVVNGLYGVKYFDKVTSMNMTETRRKIILEEQIDNVYSDVPGTVTVDIKGVKNDVRTVKVKKSGFISNSNSKETLATDTDIVLWNPWRERAKTMKDFDADEYKIMVAVESGRVSQNQLLAAGQSYTLQQWIVASPMKTSAA